MILLTLILGCDTEPEPTEPEPTEVEPERPNTQTISLSQQKPSIVVALPELDLPPELQAVTVQLVAMENNDARQALDAWLAVHPDDANAWYLRGESFMSELQWVSADAEFEKALQADPTHADALKRQIGAQIGQRKCDTAMPKIEAYQQLRPDDLEALMMRSFCRGILKDQEGALADLVLACEKGLQEACKVVPRLESRLAWIEKKTAELEAGGETTTEGEPPPQ